MSFSNTFNAPRRDDASLRAKRDVDGSVGEMTYHNSYCPATQVLDAAGSEFKTQY